MESFGVPYPSALRFSTKFDASELKEFYTPYNFKDHLWKDIDVEEFKKILYVGFFFSELIKVFLTLPAWSHHPWHYLIIKLGLNL